MSPWVGGAGEWQTDGMVVVWVFGRSLTDHLCSQILGFQLHVPHNCFSSDLQTPRIVCRFGFFVVSIFFGGLQLPKSNNWWTTSCKVTKCVHRIQTQTAHDDFKTCHFMKDTIVDGLDSRGNGFWHRCVVCVWAMKGEVPHVCT